MGEYATMFKQHHLPNTVQVCPVGIYLPYFSQET